MLIKRTTVPAEYSPLAIRTQSAALATATNCKGFPDPGPCLIHLLTRISAGICTFLVVEITPVSIANIGYRTYIYFAGTQPLFHIIQRTLWLTFFYSL